jgi:sugar lactone lactonase YvrE
MRKFNNSKVQILPVPLCTLGEGPLWSSARKGLYWVDILGKQLHFYSLRNGYKNWNFDKKPSAVAECLDGKLIIALQDWLIKFNPETGEYVSCCELDTDLPHNRSNDGKCDPLGNFWIGTMQHEPQEKSGRLWRVDPQGHKTKILDGIGISNTLAWDLERQRFYFADSMAGEICSYEWQPDAQLANSQVFVSNQGANWTPDGSTIDIDGYLWNAQWDGGRIVRYSPEGQIDQILQLPVKRPTSCTFGGPNLTTLYITSAASDPSEVAEDPLGGALLAVETCFQGLAAHQYAG